MKYLIREPKSDHEIVLILKEAAAALENRRFKVKKNKDAYEQKLYDNQIFEGTRVKITSTGQLYNHIGKVKSIRKDIITFVDEADNKSWKLKNFSLVPFVGD
jgi:hypothetical protein